MYDSLIGACQSVINKNFIFKNTKRINQSKIMRQRIPLSDTGDLKI